MAMVRYLKFGLLTAALAIVTGISWRVPSVLCDQITFADLESQRQAIVVKSMDFKSDQDREAFLKVYGPYQKEWVKMEEQRAVLIEAYSQSQEVEALKNETAKKLLRRALMLDSERAWMLSRYLAQLEKILPIQKVIRAYQIENRIDAIVAVNAARNIPLAK
jgi:hypothetical protein